MAFPTGGGEGEEQVVGFHFWTFLPLLSLRTSGNLQFYFLNLAAYFVGSLRFYFVSFSAHILAPSTVLLSGHLPIFPTTA